MDELKKCPFCQNGMPYLCKWNTQEGKLHYATAQVKCDCGASGSERHGEDSRIEAIKAWNQRS